MNGSGFDYLSNKKSLYGGSGGGGGGTTNYNSLTNKPKINNITLQGNKTLEDLGIEEPAIDNVKLTENTTRQDIKLIGEEDLKKDSEFVNPKPNGIDIVLDTGTSENPNIINDDPAYKYANNKTSSNNYINTRLETIERKADAKTLTKFVDALPANPDINTEYYVETETPNVYDRYFVDSIGTVKEIGNTEMDVSTLATKTELNLKEDLSNKTTTLDDNSTNIQYPSAKSVVDYVKNSGGGTQIVETILWQSPNGVNGTSFYSRPTDITLTDTMKDYHLFKFTVNRDDNKFCSFYLTSKDIQLFAGSSYRFITSISFDAETSYLLVNIPTTTETNILSINSSNKCNLVNITGYKTIPMLNTYSREIRELIMNTPVGTSSETSGNITLTKGMSNYDYLDIYYQCADFTSINSNKRIRVSDLIEYYNNSSLKLRLETSDLDTNRKYISIYRSSDTVIHYDSYNLKMMKIYGVKAEPVVYDTFLPAKLYKHNIKWGNGSNGYCYFNFISTRATPYTDKVEMANDMITAGISATSPVNCYNSYDQQGLLYVAYYTEDGKMNYKLSYEASSYSKSNWVYLMGDTVTPLYSIATASPRFKFTTLWEGSLSTADTVSLSQSIENFPIIIVKTDNSISDSNAQGYQLNTYIPSLISLNTNMCIATADGTSNSYAIRFKFTSNTQIARVSSSTNSRIRGVYGLSFY